MLHDREPEPGDVSADGTHDDQMSSRSSSSSSSSSSRSSSSSKSSRPPRRCRYRRFLRRVLRRGLPPRRRRTPPRRIPPPRRRSLLRRGPPRHRTPLPRPLPPLRDGGRGGRRGNPAIHPTTRGRRWMWRRCRVVAIRSNIESVLRPREFIGESPPDQCVAEWPARRVVDPEDARGRAIVVVNRGLHCQVSKSPGFRPRVGRGCRHAIRDRSRAAGRCSGRVPTRIVGMPPGGP